MADLPPMPPVPANLAPYVRALGAELAVEFLLQFGGAPMYFGRQPTERARAMQVVGEAGIQALEREVGQRAGRVPLAPRWICQYLAATGMPIHEIARRTRISDVTVRAWVKGRTRGGKWSPAEQLRLF